MANPNFPLIDALRQTAQNLRNGSHYDWGHHGACNCGNLVQVIMNIPEGEILRYAHQGIGEWTELAEEFCPVTGAPIDLIISRLIENGLTPCDIHHIEYLSDREVLSRLEGGFRWLKRNNRSDAVAYFESFANLLEEILLARVDICIEPTLKSEAIF